jgi:hypothetical protein
MKSITTQNQVRRAYSQAIVHDSTQIELLGLKCALYLANPPKISMLK